MTISTELRATLAVCVRCVATVAALALLATTAGAFTLVNDIVARLTYSLYDQTDFIMAIPCYQENLDNKGERQWAAFPESCAGRVQLKVKVEIGGVSCAGGGIGPTSTARIIGSTTSCSVTIAP